MAHKFLAGSRWIGHDQPCYIIAEIGQNHQGDIELAKRMIQAAKVSERFPKFSDTISVCSSRFLAYFQAYFQRSVYLFINTYCCNG